MNRATDLTTTGSKPRYSVAEKLEILQYAQAHSVKAARDRFHVARSSIYIWSLNKDELIQAFNESHRSLQQRRAHDEEVGTGPHDERYAVHLSLDTATHPLGGSGDTLNQEGSLLVASAAVEQQAREGTSSSTDDNQSMPHEALHALAPADVERFDWTSIPAATAASRDAASANFVLVGYQGEERRFAHISARRAFAEILLPPTAPSFKLTGYPQASHVLDALHKSEIDYAFVATDVLLSNTHHTVLDRVVASRMRMIGEVISEEEVGVCALPGTEICDADCVISDWPTLQRFEEFILHLEMRYNKTIYRQVAWDSAAGCKIVHEEQAQNTLVLCSASAAIASGLVTLQSRVLGSPTYSRYTVLGRDGTAPLSFVESQFDLAPTTAARRCTLLVVSSVRAILDVVSAFAYHGLEIASFHTHGGNSANGLRSYVITYGASLDPVAERALQRHLAAASERVIILGNYMTVSL